MSNAFSAKVSPVAQDIVAGDAKNPHFIGQALQLVNRLRDHIERLDNGTAHAVDDLAVVLRALVSHGRGDDVLRRLAAQSMTEPVTVAFSREPSVSPETRFSVGSLPSRTRDSELGVTVKSLDDWGSLAVLHIRGASKPTTYSWTRFLSEYANKWGGAHLPPQQVPGALQVIDTYEAGGFQLSGYLIRAAARVAWEWAQLVLRSFPQLLPLENLTAEDLRALRMVGAGGIATDPRDRIHYGELQWLDFVDGPETHFLLFAQEGSSCRMRIATGGGMGYSMTLQPEGSSGEPESVVTARRLNTPQTSDSTGLSEMRLYGRVLGFPRPTA